MEADLQRFYPGRRIAEWWRWLKQVSGRQMTSRELWVLLEQMPEDSATATALRDGEWTTDRHLLVRIANQLALSRADFVNSHGGNLTPEPILTPTQVRVQEEEKVAAAKAQRSLHDLIHGRLTVAGATRITPRTPEVEVH